MVLLSSLPMTTRVIIAGVEVYQGGADSYTGTPTLLDDMQFTWGRDTNIDQPEPGSCTFTLRVELRNNPTPLPMFEVIQEDAKVEIWVDFTLEDASVQPKLVWQGNVLNAQGSAAGYNAYQVSVTAMDPSAPLADETIGDTPWAVNTVAARAARTLELAQTDTAPIVIDSSIASTLLTYRDVDAQPVLGLLQDIAQSAGAVLWVATTSTGQTYLWMEDPNNRISLRKFFLNPDTLKLEITDATPDNTSTLLSAEDMLLETLSWSKDKTHYINSVDVTWQEQKTDEAGLPAPTQRGATFPSTLPPGTIVRKASVDTELISRNDALILASKVLAITGATKGWIGSNIQVDTACLGRPVENVSQTQRLQTIMDLMDGVARLGAAITMIDLPVWSPNGDTAYVYLEGGTYTLSNGRWLLELNVSTSNGLGRSATFADFAGLPYTIADFAPTIRGVDTFGVGPPDDTEEGFGMAPFGAGMFGV